jgi:hypothetical protein
VSDGVHQPPGRRSVPGTCGLVRFMGVARWHCGRWPGRPASARRAPTRAPCGRWAAALLLALAGSAGAVTLAPGVQQKLGAATFEVVLAKPADDPLSYEKPLPLELLPFRERTDKFHSIGTAFAIGPNRFVTAAHVLLAGVGSQYGPPALRDATGRTYLIDTVLKFAVPEDYAVFSVREPPALTALATRARPPLNQPVFAVGNAFGEGVVIRDGLYTSDTPEELDGRWQWLRFSAAASPGNSGGPLVDRNGTVIGVVLRKSPNENLNFALAIGQVLDGSDTAGTIETRSSYRLAVMKAADTAIYKATLPLPRPVADFYRDVQTKNADFYARTRADYRRHHAASIFPQGEHSSALLNTVAAAPFPKLVAETESGVWSLTNEQTRTSLLDANGSVELSAGNLFSFVKLKVPDTVSAPGLLTDSKLFADLLLKGAPLQRQVGPDAVRVTSLGPAQQEEWYADGYGRRWQLRTWLVPYNDIVVVAVSLPTPDGAVVLLAQAQTFTQGILREELKQLLDFVYVSYDGTLRQWREFLAQPAPLPAVFATLQLQFEYGRGFALKTPRFEFLMPAAVQTVAADSILTLRFSFFADAERTVWDVGGVELADRRDRLHWIDVLRRPRPGAALPDEYAIRWRAMSTGSRPYDGVPYPINGGTRIDATANGKALAAGKTSVGYAIEVTADGQRAAPDMRRDLATVLRGFSVFEN